MKRFEALDIFRGMTICLMIIVNTPGDGASTFSLLLHADWHGFTPTDLVFPSFLFAVGNALAFVMPKWKDWEFKDVFLKLLKRSAVIFLLGFIMYWFPFFRQDASGAWSFIPFSDTRMLGVLQRIAICYFAGALMIHFFSTKTLYWVSGGLLLGYWAIMSWFGDLTMLGNAGQTLDLLILGEGHMYHGEGVAFEPEGILSTLPSIVNVIGGYLLGLYLKEGVNYEKLAKVMLYGAYILLVAYLWNFIFPFNKKLWTSSFVVLTIGLDFIIIGIIIYLTEFSAKPYKFSFFQTFGKNPLFIYLLSEYLAITMYVVKIGDRSLFRVVYESLFSWLPPYINSLAFALVFMMICWAAGKWLEKRNIYIKV
ncbi:MAG: DUF5009 domain-containing protein [Imperialibacter sp.]|uniref:acyltransferase family protein n=1 Tax=Imperialibacter sp. TaxID=2038411 RepID=UPI0032ED0671